MSTPVTSPTWATVLRTLSSRTDLDQASVTWAMEQILDGVATPAQIGAFAMGLRAKGETPDEISALVSVMLEHCDWVPLPADLIRLDVVGTGGDLSHSVNISTMAALVASSVGAPIAKHGNRAASSSTGTADVLAELGVVIDLSPEQ
ncbi:MAG: anthranilate phosphoribosyltransferase, partial [Actinomycetes bacterium]